MATLKQVIKDRGVRCESIFGATENENFPEFDPWTVTLRLGKRSMTVPFFTGYGLRSRMKDGPSAADVLDCLLSDASSADQTFEDWAGDLGYDTDSRKAERTYAAVVRQTARLRVFLGEHFEEFLQAER